MRRNAVMRFLQEHRTANRLPVLGLLLLCLGAWSAGRTGAAEKLNWTTSLPTALERAKAENKLVMAFFTGSDWCGYCQMLEGEVFAEPEFIEWASHHVIPLYLDFPKLTKLPLEQEQQNQAVMQKMGIEALPRVVFFNAQGQALSSLGYAPGGAKRWLELAKMLLPKKTELERTLTMAQRKSAETGKPLLVLAGVGAVKATQEKTESLLSNPAVRLNSGDGLVVCRLDLAASGAEDLALWRELAARNGMGAGYPAALLLGARGEGLARAEGAGFRPEEIAHAVGRSVPKPVYNGEWLTDLPAAMKLARALNRPLLLNFTGSDWCGYCQKLDEEVFRQPVFRSYANENLILVKLDFPRTKEQDDGERLQNKFVKETFGVDGFPYELILDNSGNPLGMLGYNGDSPENFVSQLKETINPTKGRTGGN